LTSKSQMKMQRSWWRFLTQSTTSSPRP